ncbi:hypothetical protein [Amorphus sp. 3PC139-8]|uniref:hypothetical protein n=1 Tax=Amorphus sp. 3PC139-8 TaxID=2735676 RepID=UPI00345D5503
MIRSTLIALATAATLGASALSPALAAGPSAGPVAAIAQSSEASVIKVGNRHGRDYRGDRRDYHRGRGHHGRGYHHGPRFSRGCTVRPVKVVRWTPFGKVVRIERQKTCGFGGPRRHWR